MNAPKALAAALAINRAGFGLNDLLRPGPARASWIGRAARKPGMAVAAAPALVGGVAAAGLRPPHESG